MGNGQGRAYLERRHDGAESAHQLGAPLAPQPRVGAAVRTEVHRDNERRPQVFYRMERVLRVEMTVHVEEDDVRSVLESDRGKLGEVLRVPAVEDPHAIGSD